LGRGDLDFPLVSTALLVVHFHNGHDLPHALTWAHGSDPGEEWRTVAAWTVWTDICYLQQTWHATVSGQMLSESVTDQLREAFETGGMCG
jgi:hypothetical protein